MHLFLGMSPHILYNMDGWWANNTVYVNYNPSHILQDSKAEVIPRSDNLFVPGKDMRALSLSGGTTFRITAERGNEECYNNIGRCCTDN